MRFAIFLFILGVFIIMLLLSLFGITFSIKRGDYLSLLAMVGAAISSVSMIIFSFKILIGREFTRNINALIKISLFPGVAFSLYLMFIGGGFFSFPVLLVTIVWIVGEVEWLEEST